MLEHWTLNDGVVTTEKPPGNAERPPERRPQRRWLHKAYTTNGPTGACREASHRVGNGD